MKAALIACTQSLAAFHDTEQEVGWSPDRDSPESCDLIEFAGRACYESWDRPNPATATNAGYIGHILDVGHFSVLEHSSASFYITGVSRSLTHELVRHRHFAYCLSGDTKVYLDRPNRKTEGARTYGPSQTRTLAELAEMWQDRRRTYVKTMTIRTVNDQGHVVHDHVKNIIQSGVKPVYRVTTANGYSLKSTLDHLFMLPSGEFKQLRSLTVGKEILANGTSVLHDRDWVVQQVSAGRSSAEIAILAGTQQVTVRKWRRLHGVPGKTGGYRGEPWNKGKSGEYRLPPHSAETRAKIGAAARTRRDPFSWKNGHSTSNALYAHLREEGCRMCGTLEGFIELDHIDSNPQNNNPENVQPLCVPCHRAKTCGTPPMKVYATKIVSIEYVGEEMTYDIEMAGQFKRFVANGLVVHNSQLSQRYVDPGDEGSATGLVFPPILEGDDVGIAILQAAWQDATLWYEQLVEHLKTRNPDATRKEHRQAARAVLPNATETRLVMTGNFRAWRHFFAMRCTVAADAEIRALAIAMLRECQALAPAVFDDFVITTVSDGSQIASTPHTEA